MRRGLVLTALVLLLTALQAAAQSSPDSANLVSPPAPVTSLIVSDHRNDNGTALDLTWVPSIDDRPVSGQAQGRVTGYELYRSSGGTPVKVADLPSGTNRYTDEGITADSSYTYYVVTRAGSASAESTHTAATSPKRNWFNYERKWLLLIAVIISAAVIYFIETARRGKSLFIRKIAGLEAVDEAIGRATEMGRPILFIPGIQDMDDVQTVAGLTILGRVARVVADYDTKIHMPVSRSLVMTTGRETIKSAYMAAGRPDAYTDDMVNYVTDEQFGYVAAVDGVMVRQKPATCFYLGAFFAESLIMAETGNSIGAIQIAGTAMPAQLPFFVAACDFTLIGEELFAASAYLSNEPKQLGSLKGQDVGKAIALAVIILGAVAVTFSAAWDVKVATVVYDFLHSVFSSN